MSDYGSVDDIKKKIRDEVYSTELKDEKDRRRNPLWELFLTITTDVDGEKTVIPYVSCTKCGHVLSYDSAKGGTSHLRRHADGCSGPSALAPSVSNYFKTVKLPKNVKHGITLKCVDFVCKDLRPFSIVKGEGFMALAQALINVGTKHGQVSASDVIPDPTTISRHIDEEAERVKNDIVIPAMKNLVNVSGAGLTTDMWTDSYTLTPYITVTCHYIDQNWVLINRTLCTAEFDSQLRHTGANIKETLDQILASFSINIESTTFVSDRGANMLAALKDYQHIACCDHMLNTVLTHLFDYKNLDDLPEIRGLLTGAKELVRFFKKSPGLMKLLTKTLKQEAPTRWNSMHTLLSSVRDGYMEVVHILDMKSERYRYAYKNYKIMNLNYLLFLHTELTYQHVKLN